MITFQEILRKLSRFWESKGCIIHQGYDLEMGAGTFNPASFLRALGPEPYQAAYIESCRRPADGRYGTNPNRLQHYFQYQVILKPSPLNILDLYLQSLTAIGFDLNQHDIRFVQDDWENPTIGAWGLGWEIWMDGMEITQFTYFQAIGGLDLEIIPGEITYGLERIAMYLQQVDSIFDLKWNETLTYGDIYHRNEVEWSHYNFELASTEMWKRHFEDFEKEAQKLMTQNLPIPAYDFVMKASHAFNMLDARGAISVTERTGYIGRIRDLAKAIAESYLKSREALNFPLLSHHLQKEPPAKSQISDFLLNQDPEKTEDFLLEIGSEELPASFVPLGCANLKKSLEQLFVKEEIPFESVEVYGTPRRIAALVRSLAYGKPQKEIAKKGPPLEQAFGKTGEILPAGIGFFRSIQSDIPSLQAIRAGEIEGISIQNIKNTEYLFAQLKIPGRATAALLSEALPELILNLDFPKKMRWSDLSITYPRPLQWVVALFGKQLVPFVIGNLQSSKVSQGHRQLSPGPVEIRHPREYLEALRQAEVVASIEERRNEILRQLQSILFGEKLQTVAQEKVMGEVLFLVEKPFLGVSLFDQSFLKVPREVLVSEMVEHQRYFPVETQKGELKNQFILTSNVPLSEQIIQGNKRVLSSRLSDGVFLYEQDLKIPLESFNEKLKHTVFQKKLGTVFDKVERIEKHAELLQKLLNVSTKNKVLRAAALSKADLASGMVYEFPELQGVMGSYYALHQQEDPEVAKAIEEQWMPKGENTPLPQTETGTLLSLADKIDNLLGCFIIDLKPTSSSDPYALRRQTLGIIKILIEGRYSLPIMEIFEKCLNHFPSTLIKDRNQVLTDLHFFILNRIKTVFIDYGFQKDEIEAALAFGFSDIYDAYCKTEALHQFRKENIGFPQLIEVHKRASGQVDRKQSFHFSEKLMEEKAEIDLNQKLETLDKELSQKLEQKNYRQAYLSIAEIQPYLAALFDEVKILAEDEKIRENRLALLQRVLNLFSKLLDFSKIQT